ncbi:hypothetical protein K788_0000559 [Paraburkholderia caribensis MBA4]|uniref:Uncharacterized protein n=1 Tax=Paraburkholderia caribensis MBA4 TaxID=1323664 RepID=A0A0P0RI04_9BURK|nr:hypothetical protein K788_0000559 [Paraburkholderia caribensis MBA4]
MTCSGCRFCRLCFSEHGSIYVACFNTRAMKSLTARLNSSLNVNY